MLTSCNSIDTIENKDFNTFVDCVGRTVEIPKEINKVAVIDSFSGEAMVLIGAGDKMVSCSGGLRTDKIIQDIYPDVVNIPSVHSDGAINAEALLELDPDVVLVKNSFYIADKEKTKLDKLGIPYLVITFNSMEEQIVAINMIGDIIGGIPREKAREICDYYQKTIDLTKEISSKILDEEKVSVYHSNNQAFRTDGKD
ncbi:MAG: ABC transporter substrate-binding protein, partial [Lachnospirales bacterium]